MKRTFLNVAGAAALMAGMAFGQAAPAQQQRQRGQASGTMQRGTMVDRLATQLNLTDVQKQQAQTIFDQAHQASQPVQDQIRQNRQALANAVRSNNTAEIDRITNNMGPLMAQAADNRAKAFAKFYQILTPEQKTTMDARMNSMMEGGGWRGGRGAKPGTQTAPPTR